MSKSLKNTFKIFTYSCIFYLCACGSQDVITFVEDTSPIRETHKLIASDGQVDDFFGYAVATENDHLLIGAPVKKINDKETGAVYIFKREGENWLELSQLKPEYEYPQLFGYSIAVSGNLAIVGSPLDTNVDTNGNETSGKGAAYIFERRDDEWIQLQRLTPKEWYDGDQFGIAVAVAGNRVVVSSHENFNPNTDGSTYEGGSTFIFEYKDGQWLETEKLTLSTPELAEAFGSSVAVSEDHVIVGSGPALYTSNYDVYSSGSVYTYSKEGQTLMRNKLLPEDDQFSFGTAVALSENYLAVSGGTSALTDRSGGVSIFKHQDGTWVESARAKASDGAGGSLLSIDLQDDYLILGSITDTGSHCRLETDPCIRDSGAAYFYKRSGESWNEIAKFRASDAFENQNLGYASSLGDDFVAIGAPGNNNGNTPGAVYLFSKNP